EHMGRSLLHLAQGFLQHDAIPGHDDPGYFLVARPSGVGDDGPPFLPGDLRTCQYRIIVVAWNPADFRNVLGDGLFASGADSLVQEYDAASPRLSGAPGHRTAMVALGGAGYRQSPGMPRRKRTDSVRSPQGLEASKAKARALVLAGDAGQAGRRGL